MTKTFNPNFSARQGQAAAARQAALDKQKARPSQDDPEVAALRAERIAVQAAKAAREAEKRAARKAEQVAARDAAKAKALEAKVSEAAKAEMTEAEKAAKAESDKAARDARYAARKARK